MSFQLIWIPIGELWLLLLWFRTKVFGRLNNTFFNETPIPALYVHQTPFTQELCHSGDDDLCSVNYFFAKVFVVYDKNASSRSGQKRQFGRKRTELSRIVYLLDYSVSRRRISARKLVEGRIHTNNRLQEANRYNNAHTWTVAGDAPK